MERLDKDFIPQGLTSLIVKELGQKPAYFGESFNLHFSTDDAFIKVTRPWVKPWRAEADVSMAQAMHDKGIPVARPLVESPLSFQDEDGNQRWVTIWERINPAGKLTRDEATLATADWILKLWEVEVPPVATSFSLDDFIHAVHVRLDCSTHPYAKFIIDEVTKLAHHEAYENPSNRGLIHGDLHNENLILTNSGIVLIDWESSCCGPIEWDAAQNLRFTSPDREKAQRDFWLSKGLDAETLDFYRHMRTITSLSHLVAANVKNKVYYDSLSFLGLESI